MTGGSRSARAGHGVSILAAFLPSVSVYPFRSTTPSLPALPAEHWKSLVQRSDSEAAAAIMFSEPHFIQVSERRRSGVLRHA